MKDTCKDMGLLQCRACCWKVGCCYVIFYEQQLSRDYIKKYISYGVSSKSVLCQASYERNNLYFMAALQRNPNMLELYNKLALLVG